jgi:TRAP-type mannitol/chloroaromatic compound transport system permease small subunit
VAGFLLNLQGLAELVRCWRAMKSGVWMDRLEDVRETEDMLMEDS